MHTPRSSFAPFVAIIALLSMAVASFAASPARRYLRFVDEPPRQRLETSIIKLENKDGVKVDLIGAVHIGDAPYYAQLNERFKAYDAVLYEMVKPKEVQNVGDRAGRSNSWIAVIQRFMKNQLELSYQLDKIDYTAKNFVHADLDAETFAKKQEEQGESMLSMMLTSMMREFAKTPQERLKNEVMIEDLLNAIQAPDSERQLKLVLARQFENMEETMEAFGDDSVIIGERNKKALQVLREEMESGKKHLAIFYGAGHLQGMEELMTTLMGFTSVGEPEWLEAWDLSAVPAAPRQLPPPLPTTKPAAALP